MKKLPPCPSCGNTDISVTPVFQLFHVSCGSCGTEPEYTSRTEKQAIEDWEDLVEEYKRDPVKAVRDSVEEIGFYAAMHEEVDHSHVTDEKFHALRKKYLESVEELSEYLQVDIDE